MMTRKVLLPAVALLCAGAAVAFAEGALNAVNAIYNDLGPYDNTVKTEFWNLTGHAGVNVSEEASVCASEWFDPRCGQSVIAGGCAVDFGKPGHIIILK